MPKLCPVDPCFLDEGHNLCHFGTLASQALFCAFRLECQVPLPDSEHHPELLKPLDLWVSGAPVELKSAPVEAKSTRHMRDGIGFLIAVTYTDKYVVRTEACIRVPICMHMHIHLHTHTHTDANVHIHIHIHIHIYIHTGCRPT